MLILVYLLSERKSFKGKERMDDFIFTENIRVKRKWKIREIFTDKKSFLILHSYSPLQKIMRIVFDLLKTGFSIIISLSVFLDQGNFVWNQKNKGD